MRFLCDEILLSMGGTIGGLFLPVKAYLGIRKAGLAMRLGMEICKLSHGLLLHTADRVNKIFDFIAPM
jgi:hypothetical protein